MDNKNMRVSPWFVVGAVACLVLAVAMIAMMVFFAQNPGAAPPGVLKSVFLAVPALLLIVIIASMLHYMKQLRKEP